jgi:hypothetical protein
MSEDAAAPDENDDTVGGAEGHSGEGRPVEPNGSEPPREGPPPPVRIVPIGRPVGDDDYQALKEAAKQSVGEPPQKDPSENELASLEDNDEE